MRGKASPANSANDYYTKNKYKCKVPKKKNNRKIEKNMPVLQQKTPENSVYINGA
jgi:hypothetical protein